MLVQTSLGYHLQWVIDLPKIYLLTKKPALFLVIDNVAGYKNGRFLNKKLFHRCQNHARRNDEITEHKPKAEP